MEGLQGFREILQGIGSRRRSFDRTHGIPLVGNAQKKTSANRGGFFLVEREFQKRFSRDGRQVEFEGLPYRQTDDFAGIIASFDNAFVEIVGRNSVDGMDDADEVLFEKAFRLVMDDHVMEHVEEFGRRDFQSEFLEEFADDRLLMAFAMVDSTAGQIEFSSKRSTGLAGEHHAAVGQRYDGVCAGAYGKDVCHDGI